MATNAELEKANGELKAENEALKTDFNKLVDDLAAVRDELGKANNQVNLMNGLIETRDKTISDQSDTIGGHEKNTAELRARLLEAQENGSAVPVPSFPWRHREDGQCVRIVMQGTETTYQNEHGHSYTLDTSRFNELYTDAVESAEFKEIDEN